MCQPTKCDHCCSWCSLVLPIRQKWKNCSSNWATSRIFMLFMVIFAPTTIWRRQESRLPLALSLCQIHTRPPSQKWLTPRPSKPCCQCHPSHHNCRTLLRLSTGETLNFSERTMQQHPLQRIRYFTSSSHNKLIVISRCTVSHPNCLLQARFSPDHSSRACCVRHFSPTRLLKSLRISVATRVWTVKTVAIVHRPWVCTKSHQIHSLLDRSLGKCICII
mmetsp:Transcript_3770/g.14314  ORF Transcript_3770/g.14314 Transcript_3770/m.14314 type:complete len:219 (-) Transcript_3770:569-1225(-)